MMKTQAKGRNLAKIGLIPAFIDGIGKVLAKVWNIALEVNLSVISGISKLIGLRNGALIVSIVALSIAYNTHSLFTGHLTFYDHMSVFIGRIARASL